MQDSDRGHILWIDRPDHGVGECDTAAKSVLACGQRANAVYDAIASTLPKGAARWPTKGDRGQCFFQVEAAVVDPLRTMRRPGESYSEVHRTARRPRLAA
jgi:hypothetical protein